MNLDRYYRVSPRIWDESWSEDARYLAFYLLTNGHRTTEGFYKLKRKYALADLEWLSERFDERMAELVETGFVKWDPEAEVVLIVKALKMQSPNNPNGVTHAIRYLHALPATPLTRDFIRLAEQYCERLHQALPEGLPEWFTHPPALSPAPTPAPSPTSAPEPEPDDDEEGSPLYVKVRTGLLRTFDEEDTRAALTVWWPRHCAGEQFTSPLAFCSKVATTFQGLRADAENDASGGDRITVIDGEEFRLDRDSGHWHRVLEDVIA